MFHVVCGIVSVRLIRTIDLIDLNPYFHGTTSRIGAPFWFDLLNKVMVIRSTVKPREKSQEEGSEDRRSAAPAATPVQVIAAAPAFGMGDLSFPWKGSWEEIYVGGQGWRGHRDEGVLRGHLVHSHESRGRTHPTKKPVSLLRHFIRKLPPDAVILDPFAGTGATGVAAVIEGRQAILIEQDERYIPTIRRRIAEAMGTGLLAGIA